MIPVTNHVPSNVMPHMGMSFLIMYIGSLRRNVTTAMIVRSMAKSHLIMVFLSGFFNVSSSLLRSLKQLLIDSQQHIQIIAVLFGGQLRLIDRV